MKTMHERYRDGSDQEEKHQIILGAIAMSGLLLQVILILLGYKI